MATGCRPRARSPGDFDRVIAASIGADATFMNAVMAVRFSETGSTAIYNRTIVRSDRASFAVQPVGADDDLAEVIERELLIPAAVTADAIAGLRLTADPYG